MHLLFGAGCLWLPRPDPVVSDEPAPDRVIAGDVALADADLRISGEAAGGELGASLTSAGDLDGDGLDDVLVGAPGVTVSGSESQGEAYVYTWLRTGDTSVSQADRVLTFAAWGGRFGAAVAGLGDSNGDGAPELAVGAPGAEEDGAGTVIGFVSDPPVTYGIVGGSADAALGSAVAGIGDIDGRGLGALAAGEPSYSDTREEVGAVLVLYGESGTIVPFYGDRAGDRFGASLAGADLDGDGLSELLVGAPGAEGSGVVYLVLDPMDAGSATFRIAGVEDLDRAGHSVASAGDVDGDGHGDLVVGAPGSSSGAGGACLVRGPVGANVDLAFAHATFLGVAEADAAGSSVAGAGDVDADGFADVLIGAPGDGDESVSTGGAALVYGPVSGTLSLAEAHARLAGGSARSRAGAAVAGAGDVDGDGASDVLVGAPGETVDGRADAGTVYLFRGGAR